MEWHFGVLYTVYAVIGVITLAYLFFKKRYSYWKDRGVPYVEPIIPYGSIKGGGVTRHMKDILDEFYTSYKKTSQFVGVFAFINPVVVVTDVEFAKDVLIKDFNHFHNRGVYYNERDDPLSAHLFSLDGQKWKILRSKLTPTFTSGKMKFMYPTIVEVSNRFDQTLSEILKTEKIIEIKDLLARFTTDIIGTCAFGIECNSLKDPNAEFRNAGRKLFSGSRFSVSRRFFRNQFPNLSRFFHVKLLPEDIRSFFMGVVRDTVNYREKNKIRRNDFMDLLIELKNNESLNDENGESLGKLSIEEIAAQAFLFFVAGFETSATTMSYSLYELAVNTDIQEKTRNEINAVLDKHKGEFTYEAMMDMVYVDQVISETLRKYPPVPTLQRKCVKDYTVANSKKVIEKGTAVLIPVYSIHHDPDIYTEPERYNPDRFSLEEMKNRHPTSFLGFGDGPRNCIGLRFGRMQSKVGLVMLIKNYRFKICDKTPIPMKFSLSNPILSPEGGLYLTVEKI